MSTPRQTPVPSELLKALEEKTPEEQLRIKRVWQLLGHLDPEEGGAELNIPDTEEALAALEAALDVDPAPAPKTFAGDRSPTPRKQDLARQRETDKMPWLTMAASVFLLLFAVMIWYWRVPVVIKAPPGTQQVVVLPDQSKVTLNSGSEIKYARRFESWPLIAANKRRVHLQGEAFFEITEMAKPFVVESYNAHVRVLGTSFNVWARPHDATPETRVTLATGQVLVTSIETNEEELKTTLSEAGQTAHVFTTADGQIRHIKDTVPVNRADAWRTKGFAAVNRTAASIVSEIERRYNIRIEMDAAVDGNHMLTFYLKENPTAEELLENMCLSMGCQFRQTSNGFRIFKGNTP